MASSNQKNLLDQDPQTLTDDELVLAFIEGHTNAFDELYQRYFHSLLCYLIGEVGVTRAEDLVQDTFSKLLSALPRYRPQGTFAAYIYCIARNVARDRQRKDSKAIQVPLDHIDESNLSQIDFLDQKIHREMLEQALKTLSNDQRTVFMMRTILGLSFKEIAQRVDHPLGTVLSHSHRAVQRLRKFLIVNDVLTAPS